VSKKTKRQVNT